MKENDQSLDDLIKLAVKSEGLCSPSADFTREVMTSISQVKNNRLTYRPLIPNYVMVGLVGILLVTIALQLFFPILPANALQHAFFDRAFEGMNLFFQGWPLSQRFTYIAGAGLLMLFLQSWMISRWYRRMHQ
jgi:hypothetical protein